MICRMKQDCMEWDDHWNYPSFITTDGGLCAQFEHFILITDEEGDSR